MEQRTLKNASNGLNTTIYSYLETSDGKSYYLYLNVVHFFQIPVLIRHLWQLKTVVFMHWCLISAGLLIDPTDVSSEKANKSKILKDKNRGNRICIELFELSNTVLSERYLKMKKTSSKLIYHFAQIFLSMSHA